MIPRVIHRDDPDYVILSYLGKGEQAFDGGPVLTGSFKAQLEGALIIVAFLKQLEIDPPWHYLPKKEDENEEERPDPPLQSLLDECHEKVKNLELPHDTKLVDQWLEDLMKKLYEIQATYTANVRAYKSQYTIDMSQRGYAEQQSNKFTYIVENQLLQNAQSPADYFIRRGPRSSAPPSPSAKDDSPQQARAVLPGEDVSDLPRADVDYIPEAQAQYMPEPSAPPAPRPDARYCDIVLEKVIGDLYVVPSDLNTLGRLFEVKKARVAAFQQAPKDVSEINSDKFFVENIEHAIITKHQRFASAVLGAGGHVPPVVRENVEQLQARSSAANVVSSIYKTPVLQPGGKAKSPNGQ